MKVIITINHTNNTPEEVALAVESLGYVVSFAEEGV